MRPTAPKYLRRLGSTTRALAYLCAIGASGFALPALAANATKAPTAKAAPAAPINACTLLERDEISKVIGLPV
jgi:hypothetical protein